MFRFLPALLLVPALALATPVPKALVKEERPNLDGTWELVSTDSGGRVQAEKWQTWEIEGETLIIRNEKFGPDHVRNALVAPKEGKPHELDFVTRYDTGQALTQKGVYSVDGDTFTLCVAITGDRPSENKPGAGVVVYTFKRVKPKK